MYNILTVLGYQILPNLVTQIAQQSLYSIYYRNKPSSQFPKPPSPTYYKHRRWIVIVLALSYSAYCIYSAIHNLPPNYYSILEIPNPYQYSPTYSKGIFQFSTVSAGNSNINSSEEQKLEKQIRQSAKRLMKIYHPDKIGGGGGDHSHYLLIQHAYSTLKDPTKRFAYDRFGPDFFVKCPECRTRLEYSQFFVKDIVIKHSVHVGVILLLRLLTGSNNNGNGNSNRNGFMTQRFYALLLLMITEAQVAIRNDMNLLNGLLGRWLIPIGNHFGIRTPFEAFFVLTEISMSLFYAIEYMWITIISTSNSIKNLKHQNDVAKSGDTSQEYHETQLYTDSFKDMSTSDLIEDLCETNATLLREIRLLQYQETMPFGGGGGGEKDKLKKLLNGIIEEILEKNPNLSKETLQLVKSSLKKQLKQGLKAPSFNKPNLTKQQEISQ